MKYIRDLLSEDADNYLPNILMIYGFSMQELAIIKQAKQDDDNMSQFLEDGRFAKLKDKLCNFLQKHGRLEQPEDLQSVLMSDRRF